ncbi:flagellar hook-associated protein FlgK [Gilvimarinus sp. SDUM040013]|uniref:Flagellar hook-associated protein 1 n=1 Tax=Gilvimarinus gilvus TaxID=3058038 RepID=A0ABU4RW11_9GAMM|nr:flagellar hook-associated protein FlgK [Gilvimarinus sp. SDUM040013]MDO3385076.1 flagellar hook-associated protein FlgK [Gilvimarinus sp. SDUM040013]MDX6848451.1 flagellar hook-associated protein FlgK [Gilvimarinus sp. SDUM040013]
MSGILSNAISGLQASQNALRTAGHNISNANTDGYSRQQVEYGTRPEQRIGQAGFIGSGVTTTSIERIVDQFVTGQLRLDTAAYNQLQTYDVNIGKIDRLFADVNTGLASGLQNFFASIQNAADDPSSTPARQLFLDEAESLSVRFNNLHDRLAGIETAINSELDTVTQQITTIAESVAQMNRKISELSGGANGEPNDLLDKRDEALRQLSELVSVQVVPVTGGEVNVFIGSGQPLVVGSTVSSFDVDRFGQIRLANSVQQANVTEQITGGKLGGLLSFRDDVLHPSMNELGRVAIVLADEFNRLQQQGLDLDGDYGQDIFGDINQPSLARGRIEHGDNPPPSNRVLSLTFDDVSQLTTSDYSLKIPAGSNNYVVTRLEDDTVVTQGILPGSMPSEITFDGLVLTFEAGTFQGGDTFTIKPTANAARDIEALLTRPEDLALASPVRTGSDIGNSGTGEISAGEVLQVFDAVGDRLPIFSNPGELSPPLVIRFTSSTTYEVLDNSDPANPVPLDPPMQHLEFIPGMENSVFSEDSGATLVNGDGARTGLPAGALASALLVNDPAAANGYPVEQYTFTTVDPETGASSSQALVTAPNGSAAQTAAMISAVPGVSANAFTTATLTDFNVDSFTAPLQLTVNGQAIIPYNGSGIASSVPEPANGTIEFYDFIAEQINSNDALAAQGITAVSGANANTGRAEIRLVADTGVNLDIRLEGASAADSLAVNDSTGNPSVILSGAGVGNQSAVTVGGRIDITMADGVSLATGPTDSQILGDSSATNFAQSAYLGFQVKLQGQPEAGDTFTIDFNTDATNDNRNALRFADLETFGTVEGETLSFSEAYGRLVEAVGTKSSLSRINTSAGQDLLQQSQTLRDSISGVNLDEEAANLIKFEQVYNANARVISVARDIFDTLLNSV